MFTNNNNTQNVHSANDDIALTPAEAQLMVDNLNDFVKEVAALRAEEQQADMLNLTSYSEAFGPNRLTSNTTNESSSAFEQNLESEASKILDALPINTDDKGVLQGIIDSNILSKFYTHTITPESLTSALEAAKNLPLWASDGVSDTEIPNDGQIYSIENGVIKINYTLLRYHGKKLYDI